MQSSRQRHLSTGADAPPPVRGPHPGEVELPVPWWREQMVWLVISGPLIVVIAGFVTLWIALRVNDPIVSDDPAHAAGGAHGTVAAKHLMPALSGRNHAATPSQDVPAPARGTGN